MNLKKVNPLHRVQAIGRKRTASLPPGSGTITIPPWWPPEMGPYPGPITEDEFWRICREAVTNYFK